MAPTAAQQHHGTCWMGALTILAFLQAAICMSIDKLLLQGNHAANVMEFQFDEASGVYSYDLDLLFTKQQWHILQENNRTSGRGKRKGSLVSELWPNAVVPYDISKYYEASDIRAVKEAMANWEEHTCVKFQPATASNRNKLTFTVSSSCKSFVGMDKDGPQYIYLTEECRQTESVITHELGHVLGLYHEQSRHDRDQFVTVNWDKINEMMLRNFELLGVDVISGYGVPYDYNSIMHYGATAFSADNEYTIIPKDERFLTVIGKQGRLSFRDIKIINVMYKCGQRCSGSCPGEGFKDKNCQCMCPGEPVQPCSQGGREQNAGGQLPKDWKPDQGGSENKPCIDNNVMCEQWASAEQCKNNPAFMEKYCRKACGECGDKKLECKDANGQCVEWAKAQQCGRNPTYMRSYCKASCGLCGNANSPVPTPSPCKDLHGSCPSWSPHYCFNPLNEVYMAINCRKSCNLCGQGDYHSESTSQCKDVSGSCKGWADVGECENNPVYMNKECKRSCGQCPTPSPSEAGQAPPPLSPQQPLHSDRSGGRSRDKDRGQCPG